MKNKKIIFSLSLLFSFLMILCLPISNEAGSTHCFGKCGVVDTGQTTSYTSTFGEDHDYNPTATQMSYDVSISSVVIDNRTGLMWKRCSQGQSWNGSTCSGTAGTFTWENAILSCENDTTAGYTDWRLPNIKELFSLVKFVGTAPFIYQSTFPATVSGYYWSGTTHVPDTDYAMRVDFSLGSVSYTGKTNARYVRCVRAGP